MTRLIPFKDRVELTPPRFLFQDCRPFAFISSPIIDWTNLIDLMCLILQIRCQRSIFYSYLFSAMGFSALLEYHLRFMRNSLVIYSCHIEVPCLHNFTFLLLSIVSFEEISDKRIH